MSTVANCSEDLAWNLAVPRSVAWVAWMAARPVAPAWNCVLVGETVEGCSLRGCSFDPIESVHSCCPGSTQGSLSANPCSFRPTLGTCGAEEAGPKTGNVLPFGKEEAATAAALEACVAQLLLAPPFFPCGWTGSESWSAAVAHRCLKQRET